MLTHRPRAVFFDAGMTLLEPTNPVSVVYLEEARELGITLDRAAFDAHLTQCWHALSAHGRGDSENLRTSEEAERRAWHAFTFRVAAPFPDLARIHDRWLERLVGYFDRPSAWTPVEGAFELLDTLRGRGSTVGVISNWHSALHGIIEGLALKERLDFVLVSADFGCRKPHIEIFREALRRAQVAADEALHVGDSVQDDIEGARAAGLNAVLVSNRAPETELPEGVFRIGALRDLERLLEAAGNFSGD